MVVEDDAARLAMQTDVAGSPPSPTEATRHPVECTVAWPPTALEVGRHVIATPRLLRLPYCPVAEGCSVLSAECC